MSLSCRCHVVVMSLSCRCHVVVMSLSCRCHVVVMSLSCRCHVVVMSSCRHVVVMSSCRCHRTRCDVSELIETEKSHCRTMNIMQRVRRLSSSSSLTTAYHASLRTRQQDEPDHSCEVMMRSREEAKLRTKKRTRSYDAV